MQKGPIGQLKIQRPEVHNALDADLILEITESLRILSRKKGIRLLILSGEGKNFCAGADLNWMKSTIRFKERENRRDAMRLHRLFEAVYRFPHPVIARVQGSTFGGGLGLVAASDIAIAEEGSLFSLSEVRLGLLPSIIAPFVVRKIGLGAFRAYGISGKKMTAEEALRIGLIHEIAPREELDQTIEQWIKLILDNGPQAMTALKTFTDKSFGIPSLSRAALKTVRSIAKIRTGEEGQEGMKAFLEKRSPAWRSE